MAATKQHDAPEDMTEAPEASDGEEKSRHLLQEMLSKGLGGILLSGPPKNLQGDQRVEQEEKLSNFMDTFASKGKELFAGQSSEWKADMARSIRSMVPAEHREHVEAFLRKFNFVPPDEQEPK